MHAGNIMDDLDFTEEEIQEQLQLLGYKNIAKDRVSGFKRDLDDLIRHGDLKNLLSQMGPDKSPPASSSPNPPAFTKEKVGPCYFEDCGQRFFLHTADVDYDKRVRPVCRDGDSGQPQGRASDSYARYSVAPKFPPPPGLPQRLQLEADASETLQSSSNQADNSVLDETLRLPATDGYTPSPDSQTRRCIKRKVLRKHKGQSLVCDESIYTEDSGLINPLSSPFKPLASQTHLAMSRMYGQCDDDDNSSLSSSFWSDGGHEELLLEASGEEKADGIERRAAEEGSGGTDGDDEGSCSSCDSPGLSLLTSGYGTSRPEEPDLGACSGDQVDRDSGGDLSELGDHGDDDDEDGRRLVCSHFWSEEPAAAPPQSRSPEGPGAAGGDGEVKVSEEEDLKDDEGGDEEGVSEGLAMGERFGEGGCVDADRHERPEEEQKPQEADGCPCEQDIRFLHPRNAASCLEERLEELRLSPRPQDQLVRSWSAGSETEDTLPDAFESYVRGRVGGAPGSWSPSCASSLQPGLRPKPKSFIRPAVNPKALKKTDPVAKYFQYKRLWDVFKLPGEADRAALRLEIKERLAYQPPPPRPPRVYVPNTYTVPTEKKRSALRWEVRSRLASGLVPWKFPF